MMQHARIENRENRICPVCGGDSWSDFLRTTTGRIMTGDQRVIPGSLWKIQCDTCGVVANGRPFSPSELDALYSHEYQLNTGSGEEHIFFTPDGPLARSELFLERVRPHVPPTSSTVLEIGCGSGNLLRRVQNAYPRMNVRGIEGSREAARLAKDKGLDVSQGLVDADTTLPASDVIVCLNVLEHVEDLAGFLGAIRRALNPGGRLILSLPVQDNFGYDIFFHEHVWHFGAAHVVQLLARSGFEVLAQDCNHAVNPLIGLFACQPSARRVDSGIDAEIYAAGGTYANVGACADSDAYPHVRSCVERNRDRWTAVFRGVDEWLGGRNDRIAVFGAGEVLSLMWAFTTLRGSQPLVCLDDDTNKIGSTRHGLSVCKTDWLADHETDGLLLCVNPMYHDRIAAQVAAYVNPGDVFQWDVHEPTDAVVAAAS